VWKGNSATSFPSHLKMSGEHEQVFSLNAWSSHHVTKNPEALTFILYGEQELAENSLHL